MKVAATVALAAALAVGVSACAQAPRAEAPDIPAVQQLSVPRGTVDGAFQLGTGPIVVDVFSDASCPHCAFFDAATSEALHSRVADGEITLRIHPVNYVSGKHGDATQFSTRVMNLLAAVADSGQGDRVPAVYSAILQSRSTGDGQRLPDNAHLLELAAASGVELTSAIRDAVSTGRWNAWVQQVNDQTVGREIRDTGVTLQFVPTVLVDGHMFEIREDGTDRERLLNAIDFGH